MKRYVSLKQRWGRELYDDYDLRCNAWRELSHSMEYGEVFGIAIIDMIENKMVWYNDFLEKENCQEHVDSFIAKQNIKQ